jgi:N-acetylneuraminate synthase|tara:strand:+ start:2725 stop:3771 length:1047 start_codon:yes stop_codon:yes gene_type:complete
MQKFLKNKKCYFIADIGANHDGSLSRAKKLIRLCAKAGANAAKFQHFKADTIVSDIGFNKIGKLSHQKNWKISVYQTYKKASINPKWNRSLQLECKKNKIDFLTSAYDLKYVDDVQKYIVAYKIGSGDISWLEIIKKISEKNKPIILATGASSLNDVKKAVKIILKKKKSLVLMQCNTNYTASDKNFKYINLNVLKKFKSIFNSKVILGLSDHTHGHTTVLGAITLGAKVIEKHFTDDNNRKGPDHAFAMNYHTWKTMVDESRKLEDALGDGIKKVEKNELKTYYLQRRSIRANKDIKINEKINKLNVISLRPASVKGLNPEFMHKILNKKVKKSIKKGDLIILKNLK